MIGWEPTTEAEVALRDALVAGDQERYFSILSRIELLLPVSAESLSGRAAVGWGTWTSEDRTHVLSFTSTGSMVACLAEHAGPARRVTMLELAEGWPNQEWWLAVNPGLPIEGYLPPWFVSQLGRGDARMPSRPAAPAGPPRDRLQRVVAMERAKAAAKNAPQPLSATPALSAGPATPPLTSPAASPLTSPLTEPLPKRGGTSPTAPPVSPSRHSTPPAASPPPPPVPPPAATPPSWSATIHSTPSPTASPRSSAPPSAATPPPVTVRPMSPLDVPISELLGHRRSAQHRAAPIVAEPVPQSVYDFDLDEEPVDVEIEPDEPRFQPANSTEEALFAAAEAGNTDTFLSTLLLATVLVPNYAHDGRGEWFPQYIEDEPYIVCYTSEQCMPERSASTPIRFIKLITSWPDPSWSFAVNPGTPVGATLPGGQLLALANWAAEVGLAADAEDEAPLADPIPASTSSAGFAVAKTEITVMQKAIPPSQISFYLDRGYDRVSGFVHRAREVGHLRSPEQMRMALGLNWDTSPFEPGADEIYVLRWSAYRPSLYRIPYGGQHEAGMRAMEGWVIERSPFRGNGFAPGESNEIIAEFKVDSARLPHGTRLLRLSQGREDLIAVLDADGQRWLRTDGSGL